MHGTEALRAAGVDLEVTPDLVPYADALARMERDAAAIAAGAAPERLWFLAHEPVVTAGTSARPEELVAPGRFPVVMTGRGGRFTWHGPGQRVVYVLLDLRRRGRDIRRLVAGLEGWAIAALARLGVEARRSPAGTGIWVGEGAEEAKIGAIGLRVRNGVSFHGMALNVSCDLSAFSAFVPCGIAGGRVTRLADLLPGTEAAALMAALDAALVAEAPAFLACLGGAPPPLTADCA
ncbi:lipoyl(octanoyl) transferase LipB [Thermaurantiacus tibetensis]|uniref:lipoyl(octanoyl) transferase LipB n=1 Tax=Thermaurantiacus tibetensis TaxID=2759035 RepID=UPI002E2E3BB6|nr:lipoyl(octanoyl) transferase LipB [Thermaurantiacus tibetensis]